MDGKELVYCCGASILCTIFVLLGVQKLKKHFPISKTLSMLYRTPKLTKDYPRGTVLLHQLGPCRNVPTLIPFALKLETYLRMANIPYKNVSWGSPLSSKGKTPWIEYNGVAVADSQFCIEYMNKQCNVDLDKHLSDKQKAVAHAFRTMTEEHLYWCGVYWRWEVQGGKPLPTESSGQIKSWIVSAAKSYIKQQMWMQGISRHKQAEVLHITRQDLAAISKYLGKSRFLMGDTASEVDCAMFGTLAQILWTMSNTPHERIVTEEFPNLRDYCYRMRDEYWPDWDDIILAPPRTGERSDEKKVM